MYAAHFGLRLLPFENVPDPAFFFNEGEYQRVLARLSDAVAAGRGLMVVAGPIGSGKTTLSQKLMAGLPERTVHVWCAEPPGADRELFKMLLEKNFEILTYRKGKTRRINQKRFVLRKMKLDGRAVEYRLHDQAVRFLKGKLRLRQITRLCNHGARLAVGHVLEHEVEQMGAVLIGCDRRVCGDEGRGQCEGDSDAAAPACDKADPRGAEDRS